MVNRASALILAGGKSSRMGKNKAELELFGMSFVEIQVKKMISIGIEDIMVSGYEKVPEGSRYVPDIYSGKGPLGGIHAGLCAAENKTVLVLSVDTPLVPCSFLSHMLSGHEKGISLACKHSGIEPLIGVYDKSLAGVAGEILSAESYSVRRLFDAVGYRVQHYEGEDFLLEGCNTPKEYQLLSSRAAKIKQLAG